MKSPKELREIAEKKQSEIDSNAIQVVIADISDLLDKSAALGKFDCEFNTTYLNKSVLDKIVCKLTEVGFQTTEFVSHSYERFGRFLKISFK